MGLNNSAQSTQELRDGPLSSKSLHSLKQFEIIEKLVFKRDRGAWSCRRKIGSGEWRKAGSNNEQKESVETIGGIEQLIGQQISSAANLHISYFKFFYL